MGSSLRGLLILFGVAAIVLGATGYSTTRDSIKDEGITFGTTRAIPRSPSTRDQWAGDQVRPAIRRVRSPRSCAHTLEALAPSVNPEARLLAIPSQRRSGRAMKTQRQGAETGRQGRRQRDGEDGERLHALDHSRDPPGLGPQ